MTRASDTPLSTRLGIVAWLTYERDSVVYFSLLIPQRMMSNNFPNLDPRRRAPSPHIVKHDCESRRHTKKP